MADSGLVHFMKTGNEGEAAVIVALLRAAGIPSLVDGSMLMDEWGASQRLMGQLGTSIKVPASALARAHEVIDQAREAGKLHFTGEIPPGEFLEEGEEIDWDEDDEDDGNGEAGEKR